MAAAPISDPSRRVWYQAEYQSNIITIATGVAVMFLIGLGFVSDYFVAYWMGALILFFLMVLFFSVRITCDEEMMEIRYGFGIIRTEFPIFGIAEAGPVRNESIFSLPYNPRGDGAIRIVLRNGKKLVLPADHPKEFAQALLSRAYRR